MDSSILFPHNRKAYEDVIDFFENGNDRCCVIHPTGTGKSYIIGCLSNHYDRVLILAPTNVILSQIKRDIGNCDGIDFCTYCWLLNHDMGNDYDLVVLDEFHRLGAPKWREGVDRILGKNVGCKIFGCTATHIRMNEMRDMSIELFNGNIISMMYLNEAIERDILPSPIYVCGLYSFDGIYKRSYGLIERSLKIDNKEKAERIKKLERIRLDWSSSYNVPLILRKHLNNSIRKVLIFCDHIDILDEMSGVVRKWFNEAGLCLNNVYIVHSKMSKNSVNENIDAFNTSNGDRGIDVMISVNMLNEGIHVPHADVGIFLRKTSSNIIYLQQLGRCLVADADRRPILFDLVDNFDNINDFVMSYGCNGANDNHGEVEYNFIKNFEVYDYVKDIRLVMNDITNGLALDLMDKYIPFEERLERVILFCEKNGRLPKVCERDEYLNWRLLVETYKDNEQVIEIKKKYHHYRFDKKSFKDCLAEFCEKNKRFPMNNHSRYEQKLRNYFDGNKEELLKDVKIMDLYEEYYSSKRLSFDKCYKDVISYCEKHNKLPLARYDDESRIAVNSYFYLKKNYGELKEVNDIIQKYGRRNRLFNINIVNGFIEENGYLPYSKRFSKCYTSWLRLKYYFKDESSKNYVKEMKDKYGEITKNIIHEERRNITKESWSKRR